MYNVRLSSVNVVRKLSFINFEGVGVAEWDPPPHYFAKLGS